MVEFYIWRLDSCESLKLALHQAELNKASHHDVRMILDARLPCRRSRKLLVLTPFEPTPNMADHVSYCFSTANCFDAGSYFISRYMQISARPMLH